MTTASEKPSSNIGGVEVSPAWVMRRRWSFAFLIYTLLILFSIVFMGPLLMAGLSSLKTDALETPPRLFFEQLYPRNWSAAWNLGAKGNGNPWAGGIRAGADLPYYATYLVPETVLPAGETPKPLSAIIPRVRPGVGAAALGSFDYANDYVQIQDLKIARTEAATLPNGKPATRVVYEWRVVYPKDAKNVDDPNKALPEIKNTPMTLEAERGYLFESSTIDPSRFENPQARTTEVPFEYYKIQSFVNAAPGVLTYVFRNYFRAFEDARSQTTGSSLLLRWIGNSFLVVLLKTIMTLVIASLAGYALARLVFPGRGLLFLLVLFIQTVPGQVTFISNYLVLKNMGLLNSVWGLTISGIVVAGQVFFMKQFFETLPKELEEAAKIDGATPFQTFWRVILPLTGPALGALTITSAQGAWNEYFWALIVLQSPQDNFTLPIGLNSFNRIYGSGGGDQGLILAGAIVSAIPVILLFAVFQRYFVSTGASSGGKE
jgi:multiple sugar transport system permease protein